MVSLFYQLFCILACILGALCEFSVPYVNDSFVSDEKRLIKDLLQFYEAVGIVGRPVHNTSNTINVFYGLALIQILNLDEKDQVLTTNCWCRYYWQDILLTWDPKDYGNVDNVRIPAPKLWTPDIVLYNYADERLEEHREAMTVVSSTGHVLWIPQAIFKSTCEIDIFNFPFDVQTCHLKFGSWTYSGYKVNISFYDGLEAVDIHDYIDSNEWDLIEHPAKINIKHYDCCGDEPYPDITFTIKLRRIAAFYTYILVLPSILLSLLTLVVFWLPPESPAKILLGMNIFVAFFIQLILLADSTPPAAASIPLIGAYFCINMILITLSAFLAVIVINTHIRGDRKNRVPKWLKQMVIDGLAKALCMSEFLDHDMQRAPELHSANETTSFQRHKKKNAKKDRNTTEMNTHNTQPPPASHVIDYRISYTPYDIQAANNKTPTFSTKSLENDLKEIRRLIRSYVNRLHDKEVTAKITKEWRIVARVLDRCFFLAYLCIIGVSLAAVFPRK